MKGELRRLSRTTECRPQPQAHLAAADVALYQGGSRKLAGSCRRSAYTHGPEKAARPWAKAESR